ncbi:hypothetical protein ABZP36_021984 [Zizania latifolia]
MPKRWHGKEDSELVRRESETLFQLKDLQVSAIVCAVFQLSEETPCISAAVAFLAELKEECEYLVSLAKPHIKRSTVVDSSTRGSKDSSISQLVFQRFALAATELNGAIYAVGGFSGDQYLSSTERLDPREPTWKRLSMLSTGRGYHTLAILDDKM